MAVNGGAALDDCRRELASECLNLRPFEHNVLSDGRAVLSVSQLANCTGNEDICNPTIY